MKLVERELPFNEACKMSDTLLTFPVLSTLIASPRGSITVTSLKMKEQADRGE